MRIWLLLTSCSLVCLGGCSTLKCREAAHSERSVPFLSCHERALAESLAHYGQGLLYNATDGTNSTRTLNQLCLTLQQAPENHALRSHIAAIAIRRGNSAMALEALKKSYQQDRKSYRRAIDLAAAYQITGHDAEAIQQYQRAQKLNSSDAKLYIALAQLYFHTKQTQKAIKSLKKGLKEAHDPELIQLYLYEQGKQFIAQNDAANAIACFKMLAKLDQKKRPKIYQLLAEIYIESNDAKNAEQILIKATRLDNAIPESFITLAAIQTLRSPNLSLHTLKSALKKFPNNSELLFAVGRIYTDLGRYSQAVPLFKKAYNNIPTADGLLPRPSLSADFYLYYGEACERTGNSKQAAEIFEEGINKHPNSHKILNYLAYMWAENGTNLKRAQIYSKRSLRLSPNNPAYLDTLGWIYFKQKRYEAALKKLNKANRIIPNDPEIMHHLGDIHAAMGHTKTAIKCWQLSYSKQRNPTVAAKLVAYGVNLTNIPAP